MGEIAEQRCSSIGIWYNKTRNRNIRKHSVASCSIHTRDISQRERERARQLYPDIEHWRPQTRADCAGGERPCPYVGCRYHLYLDVGAGGRSIKLNFPDLEPWELPATCALDVAELGGLSLEECGDLLNLTRERIRQIELAAFERIHDTWEGYLLEQYAPMYGRTPVRAVARPGDLAARAGELHLPSSSWECPAGMCFQDRQRQRYGFLLALIQLNPGIYRREIRSCVGKQNPNFYLHRLMRLRQIYRTGQPRRFRYFATVSVDT